MKANIALEKSLTSDRYSVVINDCFYITISDREFYDLAKFLGIKIDTEENEDER